MLAFSLSFSILRQFLDFYLLFTNTGRHPLLVPEVGQFSNNFLSESLVVKYKTGYNKGLNGVLKTALVLL